MFCSTSCKQKETFQKNVEIVTYRTSTKDLSFLELFYHKLSEKDNFCTSCGKETKTKVFIKMASIVLMFASIVPGTLVAITPKPTEAVVVSLLK